jgi:hypothetical protein
MSTTSKYELLFNRLTKQNPSWEANKSHSAIQIRFVQTYLNYFTEYTKFNYNIV